MSNEPFKSREQTVPDLSGGFEFDSRKLDSVGLPTPDERDEILVESLKARLKKRSSKAGNFLRKALVGVTVFIGILALLIVAAVSAWSYSDSARSQFYTQFAVDERACGIKVGSSQISGRRYYSYRYTELFGFRFIDTSKINERTELFVRGQGYIVMGILADKTHWVSEVDIGETGVEPLDDAEMYAVYTANTVGLVSYKDFCFQANRSHPFQTEMD